MTDENKSCLPKKYIISYKNNFRLRWDILVLILAIVNGIYIPLKLSFDPPEMNTVLYKIFDYIVDFIFIADIIIGFFVSYIDNKGREIF